MLVQLPTHGLLNVIAAPHMAMASTYRALDPQLPRPHKGMVRLKAESTRLTRQTTMGMTHRRSCSWEAAHVVHCFALAGRRRQSQRRP